MDGFFNRSINRFPNNRLFLSFKMTNIASGDQEFVNSLIGNTIKNQCKFITFYKTYGGLGLLISKARVGSHLAIANDGSSSVPKPDVKFPSSKSNCKGLNKSHVISVTWFNKGENLSNCWSNDEKLITFTKGNIKGSDYCHIEDLGLKSDLKNTFNRLYWCNHWFP